MIDFLDLLASLWDFLGLDTYTLPPIQPVDQPVDKPYVILSLTESRDSFKLTRFKRFHVRMDLWGLDKDRLSLSEKLEAFEWHLIDSEDLFGYRIKDLTIDQMDLDGHCHYIVNFDYLI